MTRTAILLMSIALLLAAVAGSALAQQQPPTPPATPQQSPVPQQSPSPQPAPGKEEVAVAALGELELSNGDRVPSAVWVDPGGRGDDTLSVVEPEHYFHGLIRQVKVEANAIALTGDGTLYTDGQAPHVSFTARLVRGNPASFSIPYQGGARPTRTVEGRVVTGDIDIR